MTPIPAEYKCPQGVVLMSKYFGTPHYMANCVSKMIWVKGNPYGFDES